MRFAAAFLIAFAAAVSSAKIVCPSPTNPECCKQYVAIIRNNNNTLERVPLIYDANKNEVCISIKCISLTQFIMIVRSTITFIECSYE